MTLPLPRKKRINVLDETARTVLIGGDDFFHEFKDTTGEQRLRFLWETHGAQLLKEHPVDGTRPMGWWWWGAPPRVRVDYHRVLLPTAQRERLLAAGILNPTEVEVARMEVLKWRQSGKPMAFFDLCG